MFIENWITFVLASSALMFIPGPAMLFMIGVALNNGLVRAFTALPGLAFGLMISITISLLGAGAVLLASAQLFAVLKLIGAIYLVYLGIRLWITKPADPLAKQIKCKAEKSLFWPAFLVAVLNPKALIFYIAFLPQFIDPNTTALPQFILLGTTFCIIALLAAVFYAFAGNALRNRTRSSKGLMALNRCGAGAMIASGLLTASSARS